MRNLPTGGPITLDTYIGRVDLVRLSGVRTHAARGVTSNTYCGRGYLWNQETKDISRGTTTLRGVTCPDCRRQLREEMENPEDV